MLVCSYESVSCVLSLAWLSFSSPPNYGLLTKSYVSKGTKGHFQVMNFHNPVKKSRCGFLIHGRRYRMKFDAEYQKTSETLKPQVVYAHFYALNAGFYPMLQGV
jgi:hypothetical protein